MKKIRSYTSIWSVEKVLYSINDFRLPFPITFTQMTWFVVSLFAVMILGNLPPLSMIEGAFLKYFGIPVAFTWFMSTKTFDGKKPYGFLKSVIAYALRPKLTYAGKKVTLGRNQPQEAITAVRSEFLWHIQLNTLKTISSGIKTGECYAYYELVPYNYSFLSPEQKIQVHDSFRQLIAQNRDGKIHALQISTESSIRSAQERSKNEVTGKLKAVAYDKIDQQTDALISMIGENQVNYRFFIGFKLLLNDQEFSMKSLTVEAKNALSDFVYDVNHKLMGDFVSMSNDEILRFQKMEKLLENKISRRFKIRR